MSRFDPPVDKHYTYVSTAAPDNPEEGHTWYDPESNEAAVYDGSAWVVMNISSHGALSNIGRANHHPPVDVSAPLTQPSDQSLGLSVGNGLGIDGSGQVHIPTGAVQANEHGDSVDFPSYASTSDVPSLSEGEVVYISGEGALYVEDGT